jgi:GNAT superfamily N-acetyltransferase
MLEQYKVEHATCDIEPFNEKGFDLNNSIKWIKNLHVPAEYRKQGYASRLLLQLGKEADAAQICLILECRPYEDNINETDLEAFYKRHGFITIQQDPKLMSRVPVPPMLFESIKKKKTAEIITNLY